MRKRDGLLALLAIVGAVGIASYSDQPKDHLVRYDCRMAEISPDVPVKVKELCRQRQAKEQEK
jgi:hypothetical protein